MYADVQQYVSEKKVSFGKEVHAFVESIDTIFLFRMFAQTRHKTVDSFLPLLKTAHACVVERQMHDVARVLGDNIADEVGIVDGKRDGRRAHRTWRDWYLEGIGAHHARGYADVSNAYNTAMRSFIASGSIDNHMGALLFIEAAIPTEFSFILQKVEQLFSLHDRARTYLVDHMSHDAQKHYPELLGVLRAFSRKDVFAGIDRMYEMKMAFYTSLKHRV
jgi:hypothetical protein